MLSAIGCDARARFRSNVGNLVLGVDPKTDRQISCGGMVLQSGPQKEKPKPSEYIAFGIGRDEHRGAGTDFAQITD